MITFGFEDKVWPVVRYLFCDKKGFNVEGVSVWLGSLGCPKVWATCPDDLAYLVESILIDSEVVFTMKQGYPCFPRREETFGEEKQTSQGK